MSRELTPTARVFKWFFIPLAVAAFGFFVVGPRYGGQVQGGHGKSQSKASEDKADADGGEAVESRGEANVAPGPGPEIEVTAKPVAKRSSAPRHSPKKPKKIAPVVDPGSDAIPVPPDSPDTGDASPGTSGNDDGG